jgi:hypothetical protein
MTGVGRGTPAVENVDVFWPGPRKPDTGNANLF